MIRSTDWSFIKESNRIEGITREPTPAEVSEFIRFSQLKRPDVEDLKRFVMVYQPNAVLRDKEGLDVYIGRYRPPSGGKELVWKLNEILREIKTGSPYEVHQRYERLHPFTDCNGRSGRMLWRWMMGSSPQIGFLHTWYYQSLENGNERKMER